MDPSSLELRQLIENTLIPHVKFEEAVRRVEQCFESSEHASEPVCIAIKGESRTGKTRAMEEVEENHPTYRTEKGLIVPVLKVETPSKPNVKGLAETMLEAIGDPKYHVGTEIRKTIRLRKLMIEAETKMVAIDEFQHFFDKGSQKVMHHVADWLKILVDKTKVSLVVSGLHTLQAVIDQNEQLKGRFLAPIHMPRFNWTVDDQREEFVAILGAFYSAMSQHFDTPKLHTTNMAFRIYAGTGGLMGYLVKFLRQSVWNALDAGVTTISLEDLLRAHQESVWSEDGVQGMANPFTRKFSVEPNEAVLAHIDTLGRPVVPKPKSRSGRKRKAKAANLNSLLVTT